LGTFQSVPLPDYRLQERIARQYLITAGVEILEGPCQVFAATYSYK